MGYLVLAYYTISPTRYYKDDSCWSVNLKSKAIKAIISNGSFMEALVLNHYVLVRKILWLSYGLIHRDHRINDSFIFDMFRNPFSSTITGDKNHIRTLGGYSKPSYEGYRNTIELPVGNNVVSLRSDTIRLVQNETGCSFYGHWSEDPNQHLKDFLKLVDSLDLDAPSPNFYGHVNPVTRRTIDQSAGGKLRDRNAKTSWALLEDLALYNNESWNDPRDFIKPVKVIALPQDIPSTSDRRLIELENQVQRLMEAYLAPTQPPQVNKITTSYARLSKFEADFKQQQSEMTNKIDTVSKAITDRIAGTLPSDTVKNPKLSTTPVLSARSYPTVDPQCSSYPSNSINAIKAHFKEATIS
uniref:Transposable element protein, putative n=1 Tax=Tanacetum cinerariifolium TaxID=118510 RepID=A0A6L2KQI9_TANCI|nr:transposable element protein, putative [Tanacetum cinerariifolium]